MTKGSIVVHAMLGAVLSFILNAQAAYTDDCIMFSSEASFTLKTYNAAANWDGTLWTSTDKTNWTEWNGNVVTAAQTGGDGAYNLYVRGNTINTMITGDLNRMWVLAGSKGIACSGNIETLRGATGSAPSSTKMANECYALMFEDCTLLTSAPELPSTVLAYECYASMFNGCTSLTSAPALPATMLTNECYASMFRSCTSLTSAPALPATELADGCYRGMFVGCSALTEPPVLPATVLADECYRSMFSSCTSLTNAPVLPATTLAEGCYMTMFFSCASLASAPALPATTLADYCYEGMFMYCTSLEVNATAPGKGWKISATSTTAQDWGVSMFWGTKGTLQGQPDLNTTYYIASTPTEPNDDCITFSSSVSFTLKTYNSEKNWDGTLWTSTDKMDWTEWNGEEVAASKTADTYYLYVRGNTSNTVITGRQVYPYDRMWVLSGSDDIACTGNIETLRGATGENPSPTKMGDYCYDAMFSRCTSLSSAPALPATTLAVSCYEFMFAGCTSLTDAPALPATTLAGWCYCNMFYGCTSLTSAPALPATILTGEDCYAWMFEDCTSLTSAPELPATTLATGCYKFMFSGCTSLTDVPVLPATKLAYCCYFFMFEDCKALEVNAVAPGKEWKIPATKTTETVWGLDMFSGTKGTLQGQPDLNTTYYIASAPKSNHDCITFSSTASFTLKTCNTGKSWDGTLWTSTDKTHWTEWNGAEVAASKTTGTYNLYVRGNTSNTVITGLNVGSNWVLAGSEGIDCSGNIETLRGATGNAPSPTQMADWCYCNLFRDCTLLKSAPTLPATSLADCCYAGMFVDCTSLMSAPTLLPATSLTYGCYNGMFARCTSLANAPALPAETLSPNCYFRMFNDCTSLMSAPALLAMNLVECCYYAMFSGCASLTNAPALPATTLAGGCYREMFSGCTALTTAPELPATTLADYCYYSMFGGCTAIELNATAPGREWKISAISTTATNWGTDMFSGTKGTLQGQPALNTTYYIASARMPGTEDNPWQIGAGDGDTLNAWTNGTGKLIVEGAGKMRPFAADGSDVPWPVADVSAVEISGDVTGIGQNAWLGLGDGVTYNGLSATAAKTMSGGFGGTSEYGRMAFKGFLIEDGVVQATVALETAKSLTNEWAEVKLEAKDVSVDSNGRIVIIHDAGIQDQGFYLMQPMK